MRQRVAVQEPFGGIVEHAEYVAALPHVDQRRVAVVAARKRGVVAQRDAGRLAAPKD